jgi:RNA polymerase sigma factor (sigma-70 family)
MQDEEFERLYAAEAARLFSYLTYRTGDRMLAQDLTADAFEHVLRSRRRFDHRRGSRKTWLYAIAVNLLRDHFRRSAAEQRARERLDSPAAGELDARLELLGERDELAEALSRLSHEERDVIALRFGAGLNNPEIAAALGERLTTVEGRLYRALRKLRDELS